MPDAKSAPAGREASRTIVPSRRRSRRARQASGICRSTAAGGMSLGVAFEDRHGRVVAAYAADCATSPGARSADQQVRYIGLDAPSTRVLLERRPRPGQVAVEDVPARHADTFLDVER